MGASSLSTMSSAKRWVKLINKVVRHPWVTRRKLVTALSRLGVRQGGILFVHSSLSSFGYVRGGAEAVIAALFDSVGPAGTVVMPTHSWEWVSAGSRVFDARNTPSCVGRITEVFRKLPDVKRSLHPTHSVAAKGPCAEWLIGNHQHANEPCGVGSPYVKLIEARGQILLLGASLSSNTAFHAIEALAHVEYLLRDECDTFDVIDDQGKKTACHIRRHREAIPRRFSEMEPTLVQSNALRTGRVGGAIIQVIDSLRMRDALLSRLSENPTFLCQNRPLKECRVCS